VSDDDEPEVARAGLFEELIGKAEEKVGEVLDNERLRDEGRHRQDVAEGQGEDRGGHPHQ
jgi:uncharacterized protein YjbJ (UPF0337 family)